MKAKTTSSKTSSSAAHSSRGRKHKDRAPRKQVPPPKEVASVERMGQLCQEMQAEVSRLQQEMAKLQDECDQYRNALYELMWEDVDFDKEAILAQIGKGPSLLDVIAEVEAEADK